MTAKLLVLGTLLASVFSVQAATRYVVPPGGGQVPVPNYTNWLGAATNLQAAIAVAGAGDTILVTNGTYYLTGEVTVGNLTVQSYNNGAIDRDGTIVNGNYPGVSNRCFTLNNANSLLEGFTITNGYVVGNGGGVNMSAGRVRNCLVTGNIATNGSGGGVYASGTSIITNCDVVANAAIYSTSASSGGGGLKINTGVQVWNCRVMYNRSPLYWTGGGGINASGGSVFNSQIISNSNVGGYGAGGVWSDGSGTLLRNCLIAGNGRGTVILSGGVGSHGAGGTIENCTIVANTGHGVGAGNASNFKVLNTISYYNTGDAMNYGAAGGTLNVSNSCLTATNYVTIGSGNITAAPAFVWRAGGDYRLAPWSRGVDAGLWQSWMTNTTDLAGNSRLSANTLPDMGAYETASNGPPGTYYVARNGQTPVSPYTNGWAAAASNVLDALNVMSDGGTILVTNGVYPLTGHLAVNYATVRSYNNGALDRGGTIINGNYPATTNRCLVLGHADALVEGFTVTNGFAMNTNGGGVLMTAGTLRNCLVTGNTCSNGSAGGGGIYASGAGCVITNCDIVANVAGWGYDISYGAGGGGVNMNESAQLLNSRIVGNRTPHYYTAGGGVWCNNGCLVANCTLLNNTTADGWGGGGAWFHGNNSTIRNCLIAGSDDGRTHNGGGIGAADFGYTTFIENCTVAVNSGNGIGARSSGSAVYRIVNTIVYSNQYTTIYAGPTGAIIASNSCVAATNGIDNFYASGNITNNPLFANTGAGNYRLKNGSPCLHTGLNLPWMAGAVDLDGNVRISPLIGGTVDMGAYEFPIQQGATFMLR